MTELLSGAIMFGCLVAGVFFLRFWRKTKDALFMMFGLSFFLLAIERLVAELLRTNESRDEGTFLYLFRLAAFLLILVAIVNKNRHERR